MRFSRQPSLPFSPTRIVLQSGPRAATAAFRVAPVFTPSSDLDGKVFTSKRIRHAIELIGSCMLMSLFVVLALFA